MHRNNHGKILLLESLLNKVAGMNSWNFAKKRIQHLRFPVTTVNFFKNSFFYTPPVAASATGWNMLRKTEYCWIASRALRRHIAKSPEQILLLNPILLLLHSLRYYFILYYKKLMKSQHNFGKIGLVSNFRRIFV